MRTTLLCILGVICLVLRVQAAIVASEDDFVVDCGTDGAGMVSITYTNSDPVNNLVAKMSAPKNLDSCSTLDSTSGVMVIADARTNCNIVQPDLTKPIFFLQVTLQEVAGIYQQTDPSFIFQCTYQVNNVTVSSVSFDAGNLGTPVQVVEIANGNPDMTYTLKLLDQTRTVVSSASFGDNINLEVSMDATDADEQGVKVLSCLAQSGTVSVPIIENYCVLEDKKSLFLLDGFISQGQTAVFPITVFALEGSDVNTVEFECVVEVCASSCNGQNCVAAKRRKRSSDDEDEKSDEKVLKMLARLEILPSSSNAQARVSETNASSATCLQSMGFIITVAVLGVLLLISMVAVVFMFTSRRRELQKQGA